MDFDFDTVVNRGEENLKRIFTDPAVLAHGNVSFDGAEPDFPTAPVIGRAVRRLAENGLYGFTLADDAYRQAVCWWMQNSRGLSVSPAWIVPTLGTIHALSSLIRLRCPAPSDAVLVMPPVYNRFAQAASRLNRPVLSCPLGLDGARYGIDWDRLSACLAAGNVKIVVLCNPHNPIGQIWPLEDLKRLADITKAAGAVLFCDEIFADNCYVGRGCPSLLSLPEGQTGVLVSTSLGKAFGLTGLNHANVFIPDPVLREEFTDRRTRDHYGSMDPLAYTCVRAGYSPEGLAWVRAANQVCEENMALVRQAFADLFPRCRVYGGEGAYLLWIDLRPCFASEESMLDFLYHKAYFHVDAGSAYGAPGFIRMCVASPVRCVKKALSDLRAAVKGESSCSCWKNPGSVPC